jgi:hypothetical protein
VVQKGFVALKMPEAESHWASSSGINDVRIFQDQAWLFLLASAFGLAQTIGNHEVIT